MLSDNSSTSPNVAVDVKDEVASTSPTVIAEDARDVMMDVPQSTRDMLWELMSILIPADVSSFLWMSSQSVTMMFVGSRLGSDALAQYSVGIMVFNIFGISILTGIGSAMDTVVSQAYGRDPLSPEIGEALQRALCLCSALLIPCTLFFEFVLVPLQTVVFGTVVGSGSAKFLTWSPVYLIFILVGSSIRRMMLATRAADLVAYANAAAFIASPIANYLFIDLGVGLGAALSLASIAFFNALAYVLLCFFHPKMRCVRMAVWPLSPNALQWIEVKSFMALGIPSMIAMCAEWWAFDMQQVFTTFVDADAVAAFGICMTVLVALFSIALGISISCTTLVGNALGANCPIRARQYVQFLMLAGVLLSSVAGSALYIARYPFTKLFTSNENVIAIVVDTFPILVLCHIGDTVQFSLQGFFRAVGKPGVTATVVLITLWLVGLPVAGVLCLAAKLGTKGVFLGLLSGFLFEIPLLAFFMSRWDWIDIAKEASTSKKATASEDEDASRTKAVSPHNSSTSAVEEHFSDDEMEEKVTLVA